MNRWTTLTWLVLAGVWSGAGEAARGATPHTADGQTAVLLHVDETVPDSVAGGADFADASGGGRHASGYDIASGAIVLGTNGVTGGTDKALDLQAATGKRNAVEVLSVTNVFSGGSFTTELWVQNPGALATADVTLGRVLATVRFSAISWSLGLNSDGGLRLYGNNNGTSAYSTGGRGWESNRWYYVALVSDTNGQAAGKARYSFYRRALGEPLACLGSLVTNAAINNASSDRLQFGGATDAANAARMFKGQMDELHFSNAARTWAYLNAHSATSTLPAAHTVHVPDSDSLLLWHVDEKSAVNNTTLPDVDDASFFGHAGRAFYDGLDSTPQTVFLDVPGVDGAVGGGCALDRGSSSIACVQTLNTISSNSWGGGDFTVEGWVKGIGAAALSGTDADYGRVLFSNERLLGGTPANGAGWGLALLADGKIRLGSDTTRVTINNALTWDSSTWYYLALTVDTAAAGAGQARFTVYRGVGGSGTLETVGTATLPRVGVTSAGERFAVGSYASDTPERKLAFTFDEVQLSRVVRPFDYLRDHFRPTPQRGTVVLVL